MNTEAERAEFVAWQKSKGADDDALRRGYRDDYIWRDVQKQWEAWQERAAICARDQARSAETKARPEGQQPGARQGMRPEDPWRQAVDAALVSAGLDCLAPDADATASVRRLLEWHETTVLDPAISERAQALIEQGRAAAPVPADPEPCTWSRCITHGCDGYCERTTQASAPQVVEPLTEKFGYIRHYLHETARFASLAPRARENINTALELLGELEASFSPKKEG